MMRPNHSALPSDDDRPTQQTELKRSQFEHVAVHECPSSSKGRSVAYEKLSHSRGKESGSPSILRNKAESFTSRNDDRINDILTHTPFTTEEPLKITWVVAEVKTKKSEEDVK